MPISVKDIVFQFSKDMHRLFGKDMSRVVVYGSYARGDYSKDSDVDVMILVKISENKIRDYTDDVDDIERLALHDRLLRAGRRRECGGDGGCVSDGSFHGMEFRFPRR